MKNIVNHFAKRVLVLLFLFNSTVLVLKADDVRVGFINVCFSAELVGNTRGSFEINLEDGIVQTPFEWFNSLAHEFGIIRLERKHSVRNTEWNYNGQFPMNVFRIEISEHSRSRTNSLINALLEEHSVLFAEEETIKRSTNTAVDDISYFIPNDPEIPRQWALERIQAFEAWAIQTGSPDVVIGIVDSGIKWNHIDLRANMWINEAEKEGITINWDTGRITGGNGLDNTGNGFVNDVMGWDFYSSTVGGESNNPFQSLAGSIHGTHVAGIAGATGDNEIGIAGLAFNSKMVATKHSAFDSNQAGIFRGYDGIYYLVDTGIRIINCSWGSTGNAAVANLAVNYATDHGTLVIVAAGNNNNNAQTFPAAATNSIAVANTMPSDLKSFLSTFGGWINVSAPGANILSTAFNTAGGDTFVEDSGTSMAAPLVAGLAALILSENPHLTVAEIRHFILSGADPIDHVNPQHAGLLGAGSINAYNSIKMVPEIVNDLKVTTISGPQEVIQNQPFVFTVGVKNIGRNAASG